MADTLTTATPDRATPDRATPDRATPELATTEPATTEPATRGTLTVADRVIERIAAIAAAQVRGVVRTGSRWDSAVGRQLPRVDTRTAGSRARIVVEIAVEWPAALGEVASGVRSAVAERLQTLAAVDADGVDVVVVKIVLPTSAGRAS